MAEADPPAAPPDDNPSNADPRGSLGERSESAVQLDSGSADIDQAAIDEILRQASFEDVPNSGDAPEAAGASPRYDSSRGQPTAAGRPGMPDPSTVAAAAAAEDIQLPNFQQVIQDAQVSSIDLLRDVDLNVRIELGRSRMMVEDVLKLGEGSVVELDKLAGDPVDVFVNERLVARGEVLVLNDNFCVRINEIVAGAKEEPL